MTAKVLFGHMTDIPPSLIGLIDQLIETDFIPLFRNPWLIPSPGPAHNISSAYGAVGPWPVLPRRCCLSHWKIAKNSVIVLSLELPKE